MPAKINSTVKEFDLLQILGVKPKKLVNCLVKSLGQKVKKGELVAENKGVFGRKEFLSPVDGILDSLSEEGLLRIRVDQSKRPKTRPRPIKEGLELQGSWGKGDRTGGELLCLKETVGIFDLSDEYAGRILAISRNFDRGFWHKARALGVKGLICGGLPDEDFAIELEREFLLVDGKEQGIYLTLVVLGKDGEISQNDWRVLEKNSGKDILIDGEGFQVFVPE